MAINPNVQVSSLAPWLDVKIVTNPRDKELLVMYEVFKRAIPDKDEREELSTLRGYIKQTKKLDKKLGILKNHLGEEIRSRYYILIARIKGVPVGGMVFYTLSTVKFTIGIIDYIFVNLDHLKSYGREYLLYYKGNYVTVVAKALFERCKALIARDHAEFGAQKLVGILAEVNDPVRMFQMSIAHADLVNPVMRLRLWMMVGFRIINFPYIQPALEEGQEPVEYLHHMIYPFDEEIAAEGIHHADYAYLLLSLLSTWDGLNLNTDPSVIKMKQAMAENKRKKEKLMLLGWGALSEGITRDMKQLYGLLYGKIGLFNKTIYTLESSLDPKEIKDAIHEHLELLDRNEYNGVRALKHVKPYMRILKKIELLLSNWRFRRKANWREELKQHIEKARSFIPHIEKEIKKAEIVLENLVI